MRVRYQTIGELARVTSGKTPPREVERYWGGNVLWISPKDMKSDYLSGSLETVTSDAVAERFVDMLPAGVVLVVVRGMILAHTLPVSLTTVPATINQDIKALLAIESVEPDYLHWMLTASAGDLLRATTVAGHGTRRLTTDVLLGWKIPVPERAEQRRIVARIREAMERVEEAERLTSENGLSADALSESALRGAWAEANVASAPREALGSLGVIVTGSTPKTSDLDFWNGDVPWITPADMDGTRVVERARKHVSSTAVRSRAARPMRSGSVAVVCIGATIGKVALCGVDLCINQQINAITFGPRIDSRFGYWACRALKPEIVRSAKRSTLPILNKSSFAALKIPVPPLDRQRAIAEVLDRAHDISLTVGADARAHREDLAALRTSILRQAFSGKL